MKYLKRFIESVDRIDEIKQTIKDILLPISDMNYDISVVEDGETGFKMFKDTKLIIRVVSYTDTPLKMNDEVKDEFIRMNNYLESLDFKSVEALYIRNLSSDQTILEFNEFISMNDCEFRNLIFIVNVEKAREWGVQIHKYRSGN